VSRTIYTTINPGQQITVSEDEYLLLLEQGLVYGGVPPVTPVEFYDAIIADRIGTPGKLARLAVQALVSGPTSVTAAQITDATTIGRSVLTAATAAAVRSAIGAGTSNLALGTTSITAAAGDHGHTAANISDFTEAVQDTVAAFFGTTAGQVTYNDAAGTIVINGTGGTTNDPEATRDAIGAALLGLGLIVVTVNDTGDTISISTTATANSTDAQLRDRSTHTGTEPVAALPAGTTLGVLQNTDGTWPNRRSSRTDLPHIWTKIVSGSADPAIVTSPSLLGAYSGDSVVGV